MTKPTETTNSSRPSKWVIPYRCKCGHIGTHERPGTEDVHTPMSDTCPSCFRTFSIRVEGRTGWHTTGESA